MLSGDTIVAQSTPYGYGGLGVLRLSGKDSLKILKRITKNKKQFTPRLAERLTVYVKNEPVDEVVATYYKNPKSFTGEEMIEISCHGSPYIIETVINACIQKGARAAGPGEFTKRAYINGKIDLIQAESIANMIAASSKAGLNNAMHGLKGKLSKSAKEVSNKITDLLSYCEHLLDVSEVDIQKDNHNYVKTEITQIHKKLSKLIENYDTCRVMTFGAIVALVGKANSGKSTLFNCLAGNKRAIVNEQPGTTRDYIDTQILIKGVPIKLIDTAGIRDSKNKIESEGIDKSKELIKSADLVCVVSDLSQPIDAQLIDYIKLKSNRYIIINNKIDIFKSKVKLRNKANNVHISALKRTGIKALEKVIIKQLNADKIPNNINGASTPRQYDAINDCIDSLTNIQTSLLVSFQLELMCYELENALNSINGLLGLSANEKVLNRMFDTFCVGK